MINYSDLRLNLKKWLDMVVDDVEELIIKRKDNKDLILVPLEEYNALKETAYLMSGKNREVLLKSMEEMKSGNHQVQVLKQE